MEYVAKTIKFHGELIGKKVVALVYHQNLESSFSENLAADGAATPRTDDDDIRINYRRLNAFIKLEEFEVKYRPGWQPYTEIWTAQPDDWVQIKAAATGLNWKTSPSPPVGLTKTRCLPNAPVSLTQDSMGNYAPARFGQRLQDGDDLIQVATMPLVYMTALYASKHVTRLRKGEKILIHLATGGLGLAAIQVVQNMGVEDFATVGTQEKMDHLISSGIPASRIFSLRDLKDIPLLLDASNRKGFDVILGRYIDVGRVNVQNSMKLGLELFQKSIAFCSFDLSSVIEANPDLGHIFIDNEFRAGHQTYQPGLAIQLINFQNPDSLVRMTAPTPWAQFSSKAQYLLAGGFGALGKFIINFMAERGVQYPTNRGMAAKVLGTRNLHAATKNMVLDFFILLTSISSFGALATQSQYTAANNFQEVFARYRRSQGLPASTIALGLVVGIGSAGTNPTTINTMTRNKIVKHSEHEFIQLLETAFFGQPKATMSAAEPWLGAAEDPFSAANLVTGLDPVGMALQEQQGDAKHGGFIARWQLDARASHVMRWFEDAKAHATDDEGKEVDHKTGQTDMRRAHLQQAFNDAIAAGPESRESTENLVSAAITRAVADMVFIDASSVDAGEAVAKYGVDSLIAAELRNWFQSVFRANVSMLELLNTQMSMRMLASRIVDNALHNRS
ncbi:hypothetical protein ONZ43_g2556 [Nemania bipapillata]|uniref:Uncharacterized protein n=1 Tax=Nemania bipapillata TaxID=110536 RepID=A0ACC2J071_9PEZI|nr:hypothetical protein ONZ43_g2556 [Nemania bipapillata]